MGRACQPGSTAMPSCGVHWPLPQTLRAGNPGWGGVQKDTQALGSTAGLEAWMESKLRTVLASGTPSVRQGNRSGAFLMDSVGSWRS